MYENSKYGIFKRGNLKESAGNYYYNIERNGNIVYSLFFMNTHQKGFIKEQVDWYENSVNEIKVKNNNVVVDSMMFFHIPLLETKDAYEAYLKDSTVGKGKHYENIASQTTSVGMFDKIKELGSTKLLEYGHDHVNYTTIEYEGVIFSYGGKTGKTSYYGMNIQGGVVYSIDNSNNITVERVFI